MLRRYQMTSDDYYRIISFSKLTRGLSKSRINIKIKNKPFKMFTLKNHIKINNYEQMKFIFKSHVHAFHHID